LLLLGVSLYSPIHSFLKLAPLSLLQFFTALCIAAVSVLWYEPVKAVRNRKYKET